MGNVSRWLKSCTRNRRSMPCAMVAVRYSVRNPMTCTAAVAPRYRAAIQSKPSERPSFRCSSTICFTRSGGTSSNTATRCTETPTRVRDQRQGVSMAHNWLRGIPLCCWGTGEVLVLFIGCPPCVILCLPNAGHGRYGRTTRCRRSARCGSLARECDHGPAPPRDPPEERPTGGERTAGPCTAGRTAATGQKADASQRRFLLRCPGPGLRTDRPGSAALEPTDQRPPSPVLTPCAGADRRRRGCPVHRFLSPDHQEKYLDPHLERRRTRPIPGSGDFARHRGRGPVSDAVWPSPARCCRGRCQKRGRDPGGDSQYG